MSEKGSTAAIPRPTDHGDVKGAGRVDEHAKMLSEHHDRLTTIEHRMGIKPKIGANFDRDQAGLVKGDPAKHDSGGKKDKLVDMYARKRHT